MKKENYSEALKNAIEELQASTLNNVDYYSLSKQIKKMQYKAKKKPELNAEKEFTSDLYEKNELLKKILEKEKNLFKIQNQLKNEIWKLNKKWNRQDIRNLYYRKQLKKLSKYIKIQKNSDYKKDNLQKIEEEISTIKKTLENSPNNLALKVHLYEKVKEKTKINKKIAIANFKDIDKMESKKAKKKQKVKKMDLKSLNYKNQIDDFMILYEKAKYELTRKRKDKNEKSFVIENLNVFYGKKQALYDVNIEFPKNKVISIIGPSGCGKSTFLRTLNRINDENSSFSIKGRILLDGEYDIYKLKSIRNDFDKLDITELRTKVGMIFQQPNPFPISIYKNVSYGPRINGYKNKAYLNSLVKQSLKSAALWEEVQENLHAIGTSLSGGQQQRLCIARAIANKPEILLMDEPTSALDPIAASKIESLILELKKDFTIIMVTHSMQQAARISDYTAFFYNGKLVEFDETKKLFAKPKRKKTDDYIRGRFG